MKVSEALRAISNYPIPSTVILNIMEGEGMDYGGDEADLGTRQGAAFKRCTAAVYLFLSKAPNVTQGGISYTFTENERKRFAQIASSIKNELGEQNEAEIEVGYLGEDF